MDDEVVRFLFVAGVIGTAVAVLMSSPRTVVGSPYTTATAVLPIRPGPVDAVWLESIDRNYSYGPTLDERSLRAASAATASISVTYDAGFAANVPAQAAFLAAANIWGAILASPVPIRVTASFQDLGNPLLLGYAGPTYICASASGVSNTWYANALADKLAGTDRCAAGQPEITASFNSAGAAWDYGVSGAPVAGKVSFLTVVLHELGHGLGFLGSMTSSGGLGSWGSSGLPYVYDRFAFTSTGTATWLLNFVSPSVALGTELVSGRVYFGGNNAILANGGGAPKLESSINPFSRGSSYSHLDELLYSNTSNGLMTYQLAYGEVYTDPGPIIRGLFVDEGWSVAASSCAVITIPQASVPSMTLGIGYSTTITASGGSAPYRFIVTGGALPAGMTLTNGGVLAGTPTAAGTFSFTIRGTDANGCYAERSYTVSIASAPSCATIAIAQTTLPNMAVGVGYGLTITAAGGTAPYRFSVTAGVLPGGMSLTAAGVLAGAPTTAGTSTFTIRATDANACFGAVSYTIFIPVAPVLQPPGPPLNFSASPVGSSAYLGWLPPITGGDATSYTIEAGSESGAADLATLSTTAVTFAASNVGDGTYYLRVRAVNAAGASVPSNEATLIIGRGCSSPPLAPRTLSASRSGNTVTLSWAVPVGNPPTSYVLEVGSTAGSSNLKDVDLQSSSTSLVGDNVSPGVYYVRIRAKNACGTGPASNELLMFF